MTKNGDPLFSEKQWEALVERFQLPTRQEQVIRQLFAGRCDKQIAEAIGVAIPTVRSHLQRIYTRFDVQDRTELVLRIVREHLRMNGDTPDGISGNDR